MRDQIKLIFNMGAATLPQAFRKAVIEAASACYGGCFVHDGTGYWIDGATHAERFHGDVETEESLVVEITCETHKVEGVYRDMQLAIAEAARLWDTKVDWVHVSEIPMRGRHFSVEALNSKFAEAA